VCGDWEAAIDLLLGGDCVSSVSSSSAAGEVDGTQVIASNNKSIGINDNITERNEDSSSVTNTDLNLTGVSKARYLWRTTKDPKQCLKVWPLSMPRERQLLQVQMIYCVCVGKSSSRLCIVTRLWLMLLMSFV